MVWSLFALFEGFWGHWREQVGIAKEKSCGNFLGGVIRDDCVTERALLRLGLSLTQPVSERLL